MGCEVPEQAFLKPVANAIFVNSPVIGFTDIEFIWVFDGKAARVVVIVISGTLVLR